jgi:hypothetical protein
MIDESLSIALAIDILCFSPPDKCPPPSPTTVSYPFGIPFINLSHPALIAICSTSLYVASEFATLILSLIERSKRKLSCDT